MHVVVEGFKLVGLGICPPLGWQVYASALCFFPWDRLNLGPHAHTASAFPTEPSALSQRMEWFEKDDPWTSDISITLMLREEDAQFSFQMYGRKADFRPSNALCEALWEIAVWQLRTTELGQEPHFMRKSGWAPWRSGTRALNLSSQGKEPGSSSGEIPLEHVQLALPCKRC